MMVRLSYVATIAYLFAGMEGGSYAKSLWCPDGNLKGRDAYSTGWFRDSDCEAGLDQALCSKQVSLMNGMGQAMYLQCQILSEFKYIEDYLKWFKSMADEVKKTDKVKEEFHRTNKNLGVCLAPFKLMPFALVKVPSKLADKALKTGDKFIKKAAQVVPAAKQKLFPRLVRKVDKLLRKLQKAFIAPTEKAIKYTHKYISYQPKLVKAVMRIPDSATRQKAAAASMTGAQLTEMKWAEMITFMSQLQEALTKGPKPAVDKVRQLGERFRKMMIDGRFPLEQWNKIAGPANKGCKFLTDGMQSGVKIWMPPTYPVTCVAVIKLAKGAQRVAAAVARSARRVVKAFRSVCKWCRRLTADTVDERDAAADRLLESVRQVLALPESDNDTSDQDTIARFLASSQSHRARAMLSRALQAPEHIAARRLVAAEAADVAHRLPELARSAVALGQKHGDTEAELLVLEVIGGSGVEEGSRVAPIGALDKRLMAGKAEAPEPHTDAELELEKAMEAASSVPSDELLEGHLAFADLVRAEMDRLTGNHSKALTEAPFPFSSQEAWVYTADNHSLAYRASPRHLLSVTEGRRLDLDDGVAYAECRCGSRKGVITKGAGVCFHGTPKDVMTVASKIMSSLMAPMNKLVDGLVDRFMKQWGPDKIGAVDLPDSYDIDSLTEGFMPSPPDFSKFKPVIQFDRYADGLSSDDPDNWPDEPSFKQDKLEEASTIPFVEIRGCKDRHADTFNEDANTEDTSMCDYKCFAKCFDLVNGSDPPAATAGGLPACASAPGGFNVGTFVEEQATKVCSDILMEVQASPGRSCTYDDVRQLQACPQICCYMGWRKSLYLKTSERRLSADVKAPALAQGFCQDYHADCFERALAATKPGQNLCDDDADYLSVECGPSCLKTNCKNYEGSHAQESAKAKARKELEVRGCADREADCPYYARKGFCESNATMGNPDRTLWPGAVVERQEAAKWFCPVTCAYDGCDRAKFGTCTFAESDRIHTLMEDLANKTCEDCSRVLSELEALHAKLLLLIAWDVAVKDQKVSPGNQTAMIEDYGLTPSMETEMEYMYNETLKHIPSKEMWLECDFISSLCNCKARHDMMTYFDEMAKCFVPEAEYQANGRGQTSASVALDAACAELEDTRAKAGCGNETMAELDSRGKQLSFAESDFCQDTFSQLTLMGDWMSGHDQCPTAAQIKELGFDFKVLCECPLLDDLATFIDTSFQCYSFIKCDFKALFTQVCSEKQHAVAAWPQGHFHRDTNLQCMDYEWHMNFIVNDMMGSSVTYTCDAVKLYCHWQDVPVGHNLYLQNETKRSMLGRVVSGYCARTCMECQPTSWYEPLPLSPSNLKIGIDKCDQAHYENCLSWKLSGHKDLVSTVTLRMLAASYLAGGVEEDYAAGHDLPFFESSSDEAVGLASVAIAASLLRADQACTAKQHASSAGCPQVTSDNGMLFMNTYASKDISRTGNGTAVALPGMKSDRRLCLSRVTDPANAEPHLRCPGAVTFDKGTETVFLGFVGECPPGHEDCKLYVNLAVDLMMGYGKQILINGRSDSDLLALEKGQQAEGVTSLRFKDASESAKDLELSFDAEALQADSAEGAAYGGNGEYKSVSVVVARRTIEQNEGKDLGCVDKEEVKASFKIQIAIPVPGKGKLAWYKLSVKVATGSPVQGEKPTIVTPRVVKPSDTPSPAPGSTAGGGGSAPTTPRPMPGSTTGGGGGSAPTPIPIVSGVKAHGVGLQWAVVLAVSIKKALAI